MSSAIYDIGSAGASDSLATTLTNAFDAFVSYYIFRLLEWKRGAELKFKDLRYSEGFKKAILGPASSSSLRLMPSTSLSNTLYSLSSLNITARYGGERCGHGADGDRDVPGRLDWHSTNFRGLLSW
jgi:hypothetical protein